MWTLQYHVFMYSLLCPLFICMLCCIGCVCILDSLLCALYIIKQSFNGFKYFFSSQICESDVIVITKRKCRLQQILSHLISIKNGKTQIQLNNLYQKKYNCQWRDTFFKRNVADLRLLKRLFFKLKKYFYVLYY